MGIVKSVLDTDLYKLTMQHAVIQCFPRQVVRYKFNDRNKLSYPDGFDKDVMEEVIKMESLQLTKDEKNWLSDSLGKFLPPTYIEFLNGFRFDSNEVKVSLDKDNKLNVEIEGYWFRTILWEVPLMAIISELYFKKTGQYVNIHDIDLKYKDLNKLEKLIYHNAYFADFGTRRRYSFENQDRIVELFKHNSNHTFVGTSNVYLAYKHNLKSIGSLAHELIMVMSSIYGYQMANKMAMDVWLNTYQFNQLGTMLPDTYTTDVFLRTFDYKYATAFNSVRHDSGCPFEFTDKIINHYKSLGIDPMSKTIIFSDGLNVDLACKIKEYCVGKIKSSFGVGTHLTNDLGVKPLNIVIKVSEVFVNNMWIPCVKLSDNVGKHNGNIEEVKLCKSTLRL